MRVITGNRGSGKTVQLVKEANTLAQQGHKVIMLTNRKGQGEIFKSYGLDERVQIMTYNKYKRDRIGNGPFKNADLLIDEAEYFLIHILGNNVASITVDKENLIELIREDR